MEKQIPELLAPAGSIDALKAAVNAGADAVYLAGKQFSARHYAVNFNETELKEAVNFAHLRGVKVYITVNTLIKDQELEKIARYLIFLYELGVDALLVQDVGIAFLAKKFVPDLKIHASTQMTIHNLEGVKWAEEMGFERVVLAREMELSEIERISKNIKGIELEIFVHGALCYSYSGQCLISSFIGGRSGNRGMCAQPCRRKYDLVFGKKDEYGKPANLSTLPLKNKYLLSTRDLALYENLDKVIRLNVSSLKIEGRMRSPEYVAVVVSVYRNALDSIAKRRWKPKKDDINNLKLAFNRDFTGGYILGENYGEVMGRNMPGNRGLYTGSVIKYNKKRKEVLVKIDEDFIPQKGDGIVFISPKKYETPYGMLITESPEIYKNKLKFKVQRYLKPGTSLYLTKRKSLVKKAQKIINGSESKLKNQIYVDLDVLIQKDGTIRLKSMFNGAKGPLRLEMVADFKMDKAIKRPLEEKSIIKQFKKTGDTPFKVVNMNITYPGNLFAPISKLNKIRREIFKKIEKKIISSYQPSEDEIKPVCNQLKKLDKEFHVSNLNLNRKPDLGAYIDDLEVLKAAVHASCNKIYFNPFNVYNPLQCNFQAKKRNNKLSNFIMEALSICKENRIEFILKLPKITSSYFLDNLKPILIHAFKAGVNGVMVNEIGAAKFILDLNPKTNLFASSSLNIWNTESVHALKNYFKSFTISTELSWNEIQNFASKVHSMEVNPALELIVQGNMESLISKDCLPCLIEEEFPKTESSTDIFLGIKDVKGRIFPLRLDTECQTHILNSVELSLIDYMPKISSIPLDTILLDLEGRTPKYAEKICSIYKDVIEMDLNKTNNKITLNSMKKEVKKMSLGGITTGNFIRGTTNENIHP